MNQESEKGWKVVKRKEQRKKAPERCSKCRWPWDPCYRKPHVPSWKKYLPDLPSHSPEGEEYTYRELVEEAGAKDSENPDWSDDWDSD